MLLEKVDLRAIVACITGAVGTSEQLAISLKSLMTTLSVLLDKLPHIGHQNCPVFLRIRRLEHIYFSSVKTTAMFTPRRLLSLVFVTTALAAPAQIVRRCE